MLYHSREMRERVRCKKKRAIILLDADAMKYAKRLVDSQADVNREMDKMSRRTRKGGDRRVHTNQ